MKKVYKKLPKILTREGPKWKNTKAEYSRTKILFSWLEKEMLS